MELEEAIQTLKDFAKYGRYYSNNTEHHMKTAINTVLNHLTKQEEMLQKIHENFCKFDWKNSNGEQVHNNLKELYESVFKNEESE